MNNTIIKVEGLTKIYSINNHTGESYLAMRDIIANKFNSLFNGKKTKSKTQEFLALDNLNFEINKGDRVGVIGRNGAGKSTLLKVLSRITDPTKGKIEIKGRIASLLEVGTGFHPELSGRENIYLNGAILGMSRKEIKSKFDEIVDFAEVEKFLDTPVKRYSSGMYVRLAFSVAAHLEPEILVVDEVLAVGDSQFQKKCLGKMEEVSINSGRTVLFVSHNTGLISQLCNTAIWLNQGSIRNMGNVHDIMKEYSLFLGSNESSSFQREKSNLNSIESIKLINDNAEINTFLMSELINIKVKFTINSNIEEINVGIAVLNKNKEKIFTTHFAQEFSSMSGSERTVEMECKIPKNTLVPGFYSLDAAIFKSNNQVFDYIKDTCSFEIIDSGFALSGYNDFGYVNVSCLWERIS